MQIVAITKYLKQDPSVCNTSNHDTTMGEMVFGDGCDVANKEQNMQLSNNTFHKNKDVMLLMGRELYL